MNYEKSNEIIRKNITEKFYQIIIEKKQDYTYFCFYDYQFKNYAADIFLRCSKEHFSIEIKKMNLYTNSTLDDVDLFTNIIFFSDIKEDDDKNEEKDEDQNITKEEKQIKKRLKKFENDLNFVLKLIYNYHFELVYSKILDKMVEINNKSEDEELCLAENFFCHRKDIETCVVCYEQNIVYTSCKHNLCRVCFEDLPEKRCPICRYVFFD